MTDSENRENRDELLKEFGKRIRGRRQRLGLRAYRVAEDVGIAPAYLSILERGRNPKTKKPSRPSFELIEKLALVLRLDMRDLASLAGYSTNRTKLSSQQELTITLMIEKLGRLRSEIEEVILLFRTFQ